MSAISAASPVLLSEVTPMASAAPERDTQPEAARATATDFSRSFIYYVPKGAPIWVRIQIDCRCEALDPATGRTDDYVLSVRTQTGLRTNPPSDAVDPGYDFWMIFGNRHVYIRRVHTSSYNRNPTQVGRDHFLKSGWHLQPCPATPLRSGADVRAALRAWKPVVARTEFRSADGSCRYAIEYPVKWADGNDNDTFRVETGPVVLLDPERLQVGKSPDFDDFQWAYLDYRSFDRVRCFLERPTSILSGATYRGSARRNPPLTPEQVAQIEKRLFTGWDPPIRPAALRKLFQTDHFSAVKHLAAATSLHALEQPRPAAR